jgi:hypothetical protein
MPKIAIDYANTIIYKIVCNDLQVTDCYVGHTTNFNQRKNSHKSTCNNDNNKKHNLKIYKIIRENGNWDNWKMIEIEKHPCEDAHEASARERFYYEQQNSTLNSQIPLRTKEEYIIENKEKMKENRRLYQINNKEKLSIKKKEYYENNNEKIKEYSKINEVKIKARSKEYREKNKEKSKAYNAEYKEKNKEKIDANNKSYREKKRNSSIII